MTNSLKKVFKRSLKVSLRHISLSEKREQCLIEVEIWGGGIEARPGTEKRCSLNLQSGPVKMWAAVFVINISD